MERNRFISSDGNCFEHVGEAAYASPLAAEAHATQIAKELSEDDTWYGGWISVEDIRGNQIARVPIGIGRTPKIGSRSAALAASDQKIAVLWRKRHKTGSAATAPGFPRIHTR
jgi:hypothetical protein